MSSPAFLRRRKGLLIGLGVLALLFLLALLALSWLNTYRLAEAAKQSLGSLRSTIDDRNWDALPAKFGVAHDDVVQLNAATSGMAWTVLGHVPLIGDSAVAASRLSLSLDEVMDAAAPLLPYAKEVVNRHVQGNDGSLNLASLAGAAPDLRALSAALKSASTRMEDLDLGRLPPQLSDPVSQFRSFASDSYGPVLAASDLAQWGPSLLGSGKARNWLVLLQNPAEARGSGGFPGGFVTLATKDGRIAVSHAGTSRDLDDRGIPDSSAPADSKALWASRLKAWNTFNGSPHFPLVAKLASAGMQARGEPVSGVIAVDPRIVSAMLKVIGPVSAAGETLNAENAEQFFTVDVYKKYANAAERDRVSMALVQAVVSRLLAAPLDPIALIDALRRPVEDGHVKVWSAKPDEEEWLANSSVGGVVPSTPGSVVAVVTNNSAGSKMDAFLDTSIDYQRGICENSTGLSTVDVTLKNNAPDGLPTTTGTYDRYDDYSAPRGSTSTVAYFYPPVGANFKSATIDGKPAPMYQGHERNRQVWYTYLPINQHQEKTIRFTFGEPTVGGVEPKVITQTMVRDPKTSITTSDRCYS